MLFLKKIKDIFLQIPLVGKFIIIGLIVLFGWFGYSKLTSSKSTAIKYQTNKVERGDLIATVSGSGQVSTSNNGTISTLATGVISKVYVKDGDVVKAGDKIAEVDLDLQGKQNAQQASSSYQSAKNNLENAKINMYTTQSSMYSKWDVFFNLATSGKYQKGDGTPDTSNRALPEFTTAQDNWLAAEATYKNQQNVVNQASTALNAAWSAYQQTSPTIYAPISGTVAGLSLQEGSVIVSSQNSNNTAQSATKIASVKTKALPSVSINLTEIDIPKIKIGNKATVTLDAFPNKTFTGQIISIDTAGVTSSGVTTYPTVIRLDTESTSILPNMAASANIITAMKYNVLIVPSSSIQQQTDGTSFVQIMKNGKPVDVTVETGISSDTDTEIISGLSVGDVVIMSALQNQTSSNSQGSSASPFSSFGAGRTGGNMMRIAH